MVYIFKGLESSIEYDISFFSILNRVSLWIEILDLGLNVGGAWSTIFKTIPKLQDMAPKGQHVRIWAIWSLRANIGELSVERNPRLPLIIFFYLALLLVYKTRMHPLDQSDAKVKSNTPWLSWNTWGSKAWAVLVPPPYFRCFYTLQPHCLVWTSLAFYDIPANCVGHHLISMSLPDLHGLSSLF